MVRLNYHLTLLFLAAILLAAPGRAANVQETLQKSVIDSQSRIGEMEPWQKKIFDEEVVPQYQRFIKDYRPSSVGIQVDVDVQAIKKYFTFYAPKVLDGTDLKTVIHLGYAEDCSKCADALPVIKRLAAARIQRRGLIPLWLKPQDPISRAIKDLSGQKLNDKLSEYVEEKKLTSVLSLYWKLAPPDPEDRSHVDEIRYQVSSFLYFPKFSDNDDFRREGKVEILEKDSIVAAAARLLSDSFSELGVRKASSSSVDTDAGDTITLTVSGINSFQQYSSLKTKLTSQVKELSSIIEKRFSRGEVVFAVKSTKPTSDLKLVLSGIGLEPGHLAVLDANDESIKMEIR